MCSVSIVTVCYNAKNTIAATMRSVLNQTYDNIEYILVDGNSSDGTLEEIYTVVNEYPDRQIWVKSEPDQGIYDAMNKGIDKASGVWINFMNAGDVFADCRVIEKMVSYFINTSNDVVFGNTLLMKNGLFYKMQRGKLKSDAFPELVHQSTFVRTDMMKSHLFNTKYLISADFEFLYSLYVSGKKFCYVDLNVSKYDVSGLSSNHRAELYKEHSDIQGIRISQIRLLMYKIEDNLPSWIIVVLSKLKNLCHNA